jgi:hypothetical protein
MRQNHCSTPEQQIRLASHMIAHQRGYGVVTELSQEHKIFRQSLYMWKKNVQKAIEGVFRPKEKGVRTDGRIERAVLTLFTEGHASREGIQHCIKELLGEHNKFRYNISNYRRSRKKGTRIFGKPCSSR